MNTCSSSHLNPFTCRYSKTVGLVNQTAENSDSKSVKKRRETGNLEGRFKGVSSRSEMDQRMIKYRGNHHFVRNDYGCGQFKIMDEVGFE